MAEAADNLKLDMKMASGAQGPFAYSLSLEALNALNGEKDQQSLEKLGGVHGLAKALDSDLRDGLDEHGVGQRSVQAHRDAFGPNKFPEKPPPNFFAILLDAAQDPMIIILLIVALVTIILGAAVPEQRAHQGWSEGLAVLGTALIVIFIGATQDYSKERQFQKLNSLKDAIEVKVKRGGKQLLVPNTDVVVGDVLFLDTGDKIVADGLVVSGQGLVVSEASLTGESDPIKKNAESDPWVRSGTTVEEGSGIILVTAVGFNSEWGKTMALVSEAGDDMTPLQEKLKDVATKVSWMGVIVAIVCFFALFIKWLVDNKGFNVEKVNENGPLQFLLYAVTITVVSIPEGLPLAVTLTLAYSMKKMMKDNNFVRVLSACETMGGATAICSDKTGTLTENRMTVVEGWFAGRSFPSVPNPEELSPLVRDLLKLNGSMNSKAFLVDEPTGVTTFVGSRTECALLVMLRKLGFDYNQVREETLPNQVKLFGFTSARKMSSVLLKDPSNPGTLRLFNKGAADWVLKKSVALLNEDGSTTPMNEGKLAEMLDVVTSMAKRGLRCICLSYKDFPEHDSSRPDDFFEDPARLDVDLIAFAIVGIKDPVRPEVPDAVKTCQRAGITVRMVTGDNIHTAQHIARECGILSDDGEDTIAMEGPTFRDMPAGELIPILPKLRVLARSSPEDKLTLVRLLKGQGEVVAVTGDGTNDAPALKESDVGLAMGIAGTEVSKEAADIIILDDNFSSIVKSVLWGRCVFNNIRKFLVFQLSVNLVAMISAAVGAIAGGVPPLNVLQLLWVNMIMDTLAALALATENPYPELLDDKPHGRHEALINGPMYVHIIVAAVYKLIWLFLCLYGLPTTINRYRILHDDVYYKNDCSTVLLDKNYNATETPVLCNFLAYCGFPEGATTRQTPTCYLYGGWTRVVPEDPREAMCGTSHVFPGFPTPTTATTEDCFWFKRWESAGNDMYNEYERKKLESYKPALSMLFNSFIMAQIGNAFVSRRVGYELNFFEGLTESPIFLSIMVFITAMQAIIMQTPVNYVFKVQGLDWKEWLACIAIGVGAIPYSMCVRVFMRILNYYFADKSIISVIRGKKVLDKQGSVKRGGSIKGSFKDANNTRTSSGRTGVLRASSSLTNSNKVVPL